MVNKISNYLCIYDGYLIVRVDHGSGIWVKFLKF